jgi:hypothetical protein
MTSREEAELLFKQEPLSRGARSIPEYEQRARAGRTKIDKHRVLRLARGSVGYGEAHTAKVIKDFAARHALSPLSEEEIVRFLERRSSTFDLFGEIANRDAFMLAKSQSVRGPGNKCHLRALRALFGLLAFFDATAPRIRKSSADFPPLIAAVNHFGLNPRPAQVSSGFCGLRYFGATGPLTPNPEPLFRGALAPCNRASLASSDSSVRR